MQHEEEHPMANEFSHTALAHRDAVLAFKIDSMVSRRHRRPISLPRPPHTRGR